jgi:hypothetical protein
LRGKLPGFVHADFIGTTPKQETSPYLGSSIQLSFQKRGRDQPNVSANDFCQ